MTSKKWIGISLPLILLLLIAITVLMAWTDTYSILHTKQKLYPSEPNRNFLKTEYIRTHPKLYDSFIFGSSKVGAINPTWIKGMNFYNMTYSAGIPHEHLLNIKLFLKSGVKIKNLLIGLEEISYQEPFIKHQHQGLTKAHPDAIQQPWFQYYLFYFFRFPTKLDRSNFIAKLSHNNERFPMDVIDQASFYSMLESEYKNRNIDVTAYINQKKFLIPAGYHGNELKSTLNDIKEIIDICKKHHINVTFFINPIHHVTYDATDKVLFAEFKHSLAALTDYYDFSGPNSITKNNLYWSDTTHYDMKIGKFILQYIYRSGNTPKDFGQYVHKTVK